MISIILIVVGGLLLIPWIRKSKQELESEPLGFGYFLWLLAMTMILLGILKLFL